MESLFNKTVQQVRSVTEDTLTTSVDIPTLAVELPGAGNYLITGMLPFTAGDATERAIGIGLNYSGTVAFCRAVFRDGAAAAAQTTAGTLASFAANTAEAGSFEFAAVLAVKTAGTVKLQFSRDAAALTFAWGSMTVTEGLSS